MLIVLQKHLSKYLAHILAKNGKPFSDSEIVKECMIAACDSLFEGHQKEEVKKAHEQIPLSRQTNTRRIEQIDEDVSTQLVHDVQTASQFSLALDESTDIADIAQLCVYVRFLKGDEFVEELLCLLPLEGSTRGEDIHAALAKFLNDENIPIDNALSITTDGAPAMVGRHSGLVALMKDSNPKLLSYHCLIHQSVLCGKLNPQFQEILTTIMKLVNFLRSSSALTHRNFRAFLQHVSAEYNDLLLYNNVRWLSKGHVLDRVWTLRTEIKDFLETLENKKASDFLDFMSSSDNMRDIAFLVDVFAHMNTLNLKLQGKKHTICDLYTDIREFKASLGLYRKHLKNERLVHFPTLDECIKEGNIELSTSYVDFIDAIVDNFNSRFSEFTPLADMFLMINNPFSFDDDAAGWIDNVKLVCSDVDETKIELELVTLKVDTTLECLMKAKDKSKQDFWLNDVNPEKYPQLRNVALSVLTMFGSTYICESSFSRMNHIKNKNRSTLTDKHMEACLRLAVSNYKPNFDKLCAAVKSHCSH